MNTTTSAPTSTSPLQHRAFRLFLGGRIVSLLGNSMAPLALAFAVLRYSKNTGDLGLILGGEGAALVLFTAIGGVVGGRYSRSQVLIASTGDPIPAAAVSIRSLSILKTS